MSPHLNKSITLIELLIAIVLMSLVVLGFSSIDLFSRYHVITSDRRIKAQNEASYALEHMSKEIVKAIGNERVYGTNTVVDLQDPIGTEAARIKVYIDANQNGLRETVSGTDYWIAYRFHNSGSESYQILYCRQCRNKPCTQCESSWETLSNKITNFNVSKSLNFVEVQITARWDPALASSSDNPSVNMRNRISMPSVSTN